MLCHSHCLSQVLLPLRQALAVVGCTSTPPTCSWQLLLLSLAVLQTDDPRRSTLTRCCMYDVRRALGISRGGDAALMAVAHLAGGDYDTGGADNVGEALALGAVRQLLTGCQVSTAALCICGFLAFLRSISRAHRVQHVVRLRGLLSPCLLPPFVVQPSHHGSTQYTQAVCITCRQQLMLFSLQQKCLLVCWCVQDDELVLQKLEAAIARGPDPELEALTKCTGCKVCGHEGNRKNRINAHSGEGQGPVSAAQMGV